MQLARQFVFLLSGLCGLLACEREKVPELVHFAFVVPVRIEPGAATVARGDTLWLSVNFSDSLLDLRSNQRYRARQQDLKLDAAVGFRKLLGPTQSLGSNAQDFVVVNRLGQLLPGGATFRRWEPVYDGHRYRARIGIIPQKTGVYALTLLSALDTPDPLPFLTVSPGADGEARRAVLDDVYYIINEGDVHFDLQQQHSLVISTRPEATEASIYYEQQGTFTFVVR